MTISADQEIRQLQRQIEKNKRTIGLLRIQMNRALYIANNKAENIQRLRKENDGLIQRINELDDQKFKDRVEIVPVDHGDRDRRV